MGHPSRDLAALGTQSKPAPRLSAYRASTNPRQRIRWIDLEVFANEEIGAQIRVLISERGEPWFVGADISRALDVHASVIRKLDEGERLTVALRTPDGGLQIECLVSESGLYALLGMFLLCGREPGKPDPAPLRGWIANAVLPWLHRHYGDLSSEIVKVLTEEAA